MAIEKVESAFDERLIAYTTLTNRELRRSLETASGIFIAESTFVVEKALDVGLRPLSLLLARRRLGALEALLAKVPPEVVVYAASDEVIREITGYRVHRGVLAAFERPQLSTPEEVLRCAHKVCVLEASVDATNVGAIFRSAAALGADALLLDPACADPLERRCVRVSMGCVLSIP